MRETKIREIVREKEAIENDLKKMNDLKFEAYKVFDNGWVMPLPKVKKSCEESGPWSEIINWHYDSGKHAGCFFLRHPDVIKQNFEKLDSAIINRKEFEENLSEAREDVENYIKNLEESLEEVKKELDVAYYEFLQNETGEYKWIFEQPFMKEILLKFLTF